MELEDVEGQEGQGQQMGPALVALWCKAVNMQQTGAIIDAIHVAVIVHTVTSRIVRILKAKGWGRGWRRTRARRVGTLGWGCGCCPRLSLYRRQWFPSYYVWGDPVGTHPLYSGPAGQGEEMEGTATARAQENRIVQ